jgi:methionyl-tRNA synthetase
MISGTWFRGHLRWLRKNFSNGMPYPSAIEGRLALDQELEKKALATVEAYQAHMNGLAFSKALESVWDLLAHANRYLNESAPWALTE